MPVLRLPKLLDVAKLDCTYLSDSRLLCEHIRLRVAAKNYHSLE